MTTKQVRRAWFASILTTLALLAACGGSDSDNPNNDGGTGDALPNDGPCVPESRRCNGNDAQQCNAEGTMWVTVEACATFCQEGVCALDGLDVQSDMALDGVVVVAGAVTVRSAATLSSPTGNLTIFADTLAIESGGAIAMAPTGATPEGKGVDASCSSCGNSGGAYGNGSRPYGSATDSEVQAGAEGSRVFGSTTVAVAKGGGVVRLIVKDSANVAGQITANGANGGDGRVKLLHGSPNDITGTVLGVLTEGLAPPIPVKSLSHPDGSKVYNDGFLSFDVEWNKAFPSAMGYFVRLDQVKNGPPTAANGEFVAADKVSFSPNDIFNGENYVHIVSIDAQSAVGAVESVFRVQINTLGPSMSSDSHPDEFSFSNNTNPFFRWDFPQGDANVTGTHYVLDNFGLTVPTTADPALPATQKQLLQTGVTPGVWVLHVVSVDGQGRLTKAAGHYRVNIGNDPGAGSIQGNVVDSNSQPVVGATVTVNRGLFSTTTSSNGTYTLPGVTAGSWELSARSAAQSATKQVTVTANMSTAGNLQLQ